MDLSFLLRGLLIGFSIAAPVGPIGVLCIRRTLAEGRAFGLACGMGAATADGLYGCVAGFGLTFVSSFLLDQQMWLRLIGGVFLCCLGIKTFLSKPAEKPAGRKVLVESDGEITEKEASTADSEKPVAQEDLTERKGFSAARKRLISAYISTFFLTITNPMTILSFAAIFAGLGVGGTNGNYLAATVLVLGVFLGSAIWWVILSSGVNLLRHKFNHQGLQWVNRISGVIITGFGIFAFLNLLR